MDVSERAWFKGGHDKLYAGDFHPATLLGKKLPYSADPWRFVDAAGPVRRSDGSYRGVLCVHMSWGWARRLVQTILAPADRQYSADIFVVRGDGTVMLGPKGMEERQISSDSLALSQSGKPGAVKETWADGSRLPDRLFPHRHQRRPGHADLVGAGAPAGRKSRWPTPTRWNARSCCWAPSSASPWRWRPRRWRAG